MHLGEAVIVSVFHVHNCSKQNDPTRVHSTLAGKTNNTIQTKLARDAAVTHPTLITSLVLVFAVAIGFLRLLVDAYSTRIHP